MLDIGCGNGATACKLIELGYNVYGIDASESGIEFANKRHKGRFFVQDVSSSILPDKLKDKQFDIVISTEVVEHIYAPRNYVKLICSALSKSENGELIISTPYHGYLKNIALALVNKFDHHFTALWDGGYIKFWSRRTLSQLLEEFNFKVVGFHGCGRFPYFWKSMILRARLGG